MKRKLATAAAALAVAGGLTAGIAIAAGGDEEAPLTGSALERATAAALAHTGGGEVIETEAGDDGAAYGVEIRLDDGTQVEVSLDADFEVIGQETDDDGGERNDADADD
jgi:uncharacterized membrane protein YkoI